MLGNEAAPTHSEWTQVSSHGSSFVGEGSDNVHSQGQGRLPGHVLDSAAEGASLAAPFPEMQGQEVTQKRLPVA